MKTGDQITILKPVSPHIEGNGTITKVDEGKLKYEVEQWDIKQWYEETQITDRLIKVEPAPEFDQTLCDQYKEAISEATEDLKESACSRTHKRDAIDFQLSEIFKNQSTSTTTFPNGITGIMPNSTGGTTLLGRPYIPETSANFTKEQAESMKKGLELLIETKQSEMKEIEELIKKL